MSDNCRSFFEEYANKEGYFIQKNESSIPTRYYKYRETEDLWEAWQAAWSASSQEQREKIINILESSLTDEEAEIFYRLEEKICNGG